MKKLLPIGLLVFLFFAACKIVKYTPDKLPERQLIFGNGGGFAGIETSFTVLENGQIFKRVGRDSAYVELVALPKKEAKLLFEKLTSLQLYKLDVNKPGNLYYFVQEINETIDSRATWGAGDYLPPQSLVSIYKELAAFVNDRKVVDSGKTAAPKPEDKDKPKEDLGW